MEGKRPRKAPGEGSVYRTPSGKYRGDIMLGYHPDGRRAIFRCTRDTQAQVRASFREAIREYEGGKPVLSARQTVEDYLRTWLTDVVQPTVFARTYVSYRQLIENHAIPALGKLRLNQLTPSHVQRLIAERSATHKPNTVRHLNACLHAAFEHGVNMRTLPYNFCSGIKLPPAQPSDGVSLKVEDAVRFFQLAKDDPDYGAFFTLALVTGMREGELYALRWQDLVLQGALPHLTVRRAFSRVEGQGRLEKPPKTGREREIPLPDIAVTALRRQQLHQDELRRRAGARWQESDLVFTSTIGTAVSERTVVRRFRELLEQAGLPRIRLYDLRHSAASIYLALGVPVKDVQAILGHASAKMTLDVYGHSFDAARREATRRFGDILNQAK